MNKMSAVNTQTIVVGVDVHKYSHTAVALDCFGKQLGLHEFSNDYLSGYVSWLSKFGDFKNLIVALEGVNGYGVHIVKALSDAGIAMRYVPGILTERQRKQSIHREKSDPVDAMRVGKVILTNYEETLPAKESIANSEERTTAITLDFFLTERRSLVAEKTILKNQLHAMLHQYMGDHYTDLFPKAFTPKAIDYYLDTVNPETITDPERLALAASIRRRLIRLKLLINQIAEIDKTMRESAKDSSAVSALKKNISGCGEVTACILVAEVTSIKRFKTKSQFARYAGIAPVHKSSGNHKRLYTSPYGNRKVNRALHTIALYQISRVNDHNPGRIYYEKKLNEGKTNLWALRCLKRQLANRVFQTLKFEYNSRQILVRN